MLQYIAMTSMLIDHLGLIFFPKTETFRIIGRIAFPLYAWFLIQGYHHTNNLKIYARRLLYIALLSQIPYIIALQAWELNVVFTLLLALLSLYILDLHIEEIYKICLVMIICLVTIAVPMDYGLYGIFLIIIFRYYNGWRMVVYHMLLNSIFTLMYGFDYWIQLFSIMGTLLILFRHISKPVTVYKWVYRSFYPGHLAALYVISFGLQH